jgi:D-alanyl-D-alanine carboxypeptidase
MKNTERFLIPALFIAILSVVSCKKNSDPDYTVVNNLIITQWESVSDSVLANSGIPGMIIGIWVPDRNLVWVAGIGKSNLATGEKPDPFMNFRMASITKTFTYTVLLQLTDEGKLSLTDKLGKFLPDFPKSDSVTIKMLCNHTSGIYDFTESDDFNIQLMSNTMRKWKNLEIISFAAAGPYLGYKSWIGYCPAENLTMVVSYNCTTSKPMVLVNRLLSIYATAIRQ